MVNPYAELIDRLRGIYRITITDGMGPVSGSDEPENEKEFVRKFETTPICLEAAKALESMWLDYIAIAKVTGESKCHIH